MKTNTIFHEDCLLGLNDVDTNSVSLIHTSPPYNIGKDYSGYSDTLARREYVSFIGKVVHQLYRVLKPGGSLFWQTGYTSFEEDFIYPIDHLTFSCFLDHGFRLKDRVIWRYYGGMSFKQKFTNKHETILWWVKPGGTPQFDVFPIREKSKELDPRNNLFGRNPGNVWEVDRVAYGSLQQTSHIAVFPEEVSDRIILSTTDAGELCLDPFSGSGTLCKVAKSRGRKFLGFEIAPAYFKESLKRLSLLPSGEYANVLSALIKLYAFQANGKSADVGRLFESVDLVAKNLEADSTRLLKPATAIATIRKRHDDFTKAQKIALWRATDDFFANQKNAREPLHILNRCFEYSFKLSKVQNGVMKIYSILNWHDEYRARQDRLFADIDEITQEEDESFSRTGNRVTLRNKHRQIKDALNMKTPNKADQTSLI